MFLSFNSSSGGRGGCFDDSDNFVCQICAGYYDSYTRRGKISVWNDKICHVGATSGDNPDAKFCLCAASSDIDGFDFPNCDCGCDSIARSFRRL